MKTDTSSLGIYSSHNEKGWSGPKRLQLYKDTILYPIFLRFEVSLPNISETKEHMVDCTLKNSL